MNLQKMSAASIGFFQALAVAVYCLLIAVFFDLMGNNVDNSSNVLGAVAILLLLVFSVSVCGILIFGYPAYLIMRANVKRALKVLAFTLLSALFILAVVLLFVLL